AVNADGAEDGVRFAGGAVNVEAAGDEAVDDMLDLGVGGPFLHHDDHKSFLFPSLNDSKRKARDKSPATANILPKRAAHSCPPLALPSPECMASRSAARASSMMRSKRRRMAASVSGPGLSRSAFSKTSFSRSGWYSGIFASCLSLPISRAQCERSFKSSTSFLSISSIRRRQSLRFTARPRPDASGPRGGRGRCGRLA